VEFHPQFGNVILEGDNNSILEDSKGQWQALAETCPNSNCNQAIVFLQWGSYTGSPLVFHANGAVLVYPKRVVVSPPPPEGPKQLANDYFEARLVLDDSPKASAAMSRRCLQTILRDYAKVPHGDLAVEIQHLLDSGNLPSHIAEALDGVRNVGNFAAHPIKSQKSLEIIDVEPGEAEWNLETLDALFDFYFVQPARLGAKKKALDEKLKSAGKPPMKQPQGNRP